MRNLDWKRRLTARIRVNLPLMIERYTLEEGYKQTRDVSCRHHECRHIHQSLLALNTVTKGVL